MTSSEALDRGRESFASHAWGDAYACLSAADCETPLQGEDLERLAYAAYLTGRDADSEGILTRAHQAFLSRGDPEGAARCAFWLAFALLNSGDFARGGGWIARAQRVLGEGSECVVHGYLLMPAGVRRVMEGDADGAYTLFCQAADIGRRFADVNLIAMALHGRGRALIRLERVAEGVALLDEAMTAVTAGEVSPIAAGDIYCSVIEACHEVFDLRRAHEWTTALDRWCASQADLVRFRGQCLVRRAEILQLHGAWSAAIDEVKRACDYLAEPPQRARGAAFYQWAELLRLRGEFAKAEDMYREAAQSGRSPQPGLSLLRLAQGQVDVAASAIRNVLDEAKDRRVRSRVLPAYVEIMLATNDLAGARVGADELGAIAGALDAPFLRAVSMHALGATLLREGHERAALGALREATAGWDLVEAPYEAARTRVLIARACQKLGDVDSADIEYEAARLVFRRLGATSDLTAMDADSPKQKLGSASGLSARELEVLRCLAAGKTNRAIADELCISEKTVARHVSNIFNKLGLSSRAGAIAYAYKHHLI
ncbi:MAG: LuxR C-terminal-related transcriptional regulator [Vicinamibacterales bacterium]